MTLDDFVARFETVAEAAGGVKRLRALIRSLAVRGKLVAQDFTEAPASEVLVAVVRRREELLNTRRVSMSESLPPVTETGAPFSLPDGWLWARLADVTVCRDGERIPVSKEERAGRKGSFDYYGASGVIDSIDGFLFDGPLLLIGEDGANLINRSTPIAFIASGKYWVNNHAHVLDGASLESLRYIAVFINAIDLVPYITGTAQPKMNQAKMNSIPIAVPPLAEQKRIVAKVDQLMALCDDLEARQAKKRETAVRLNRAALDALTTAEGPEEVAASFQRVAGNFGVLFQSPESVTEFRKAIIELAVRGRFVCQDPEDEPARELLKRARAAAAREQIRKRRRVVPPAPISDGDHPALAPGWTVARWAEIGLCQNGRSFPSTAYSDHGVKLLRPGNLHVSSAVVWTVENTRYLPFQYEADNPDFVIGPGELVMNLTAQSLKDEFLGRVCLTDGKERCLLNQRIARLTPMGLLPRYLIWYFRSPFFRKYVDGLNKGTLIQHMFTSQVDEAVILIPPLAEQKRIVAKVDQLMALCDRLEIALRRAESTAQKLAEAVVAEILA